MKMTDEARRVLIDNRRVGRVLTRVGDKWSVMVIVYIQDGPRRFNEIKRGIEGISQQMLTRTLRGLERDGFVTRTIVPTSPPHPLLWVFFVVAMPLPLILGLASRRQRLF